MINGAPSLFVWSLSEPRPIGIDSFVDEFLEEYWWYGSSKSALHDGLATVADEGETVLFPAYLPDAVAEPIRELGLDPQYYSVTGTLAPDVADLESRVDDDTLAITSVNYFGFPQPRLESISELVDDHDCYHVDDNAHSALSVHDGRLLGTAGDLGVTSLWKLFPIPNGALLYLPNDELRARFEPSALAGTNERVDRHDARFVLKSVALDLLHSNETVRQSVHSLVARSNGDPSEGDPLARYEAGKSRMSKLASRVLEDADPTAIRSSRRENYRAWRDVIVDREDLTPLYERLPEGICPQVFPVYAQRPRRFLDNLETAGVGGAHTWPRLPRAVREDPTYEMASRLSQHVVVLPVHQHVDAETIESISRSLE